VTRRPPTPERARIVPGHTRTRAVWVLISRNLVDGVQRKEVEDIATMGDAVVEGTVTFRTPDRIAHRALSPGKRRRGG
jgi:hypothetical protein